MNPFLSLRNYEEFVYTLKQRFPSVQGSTLTVVPRGKRMAIVQGEIAFAQGYRITLKERLSFDEGLVVIEDYGTSRGTNIQGDAHENMRFIYC